MKPICLFDMNPAQKLIRQLLKHIDKSFGSWSCKNISIGCPECEAQLLRCYLEWYELLTEDNKSPKK